jgi:hypothetical protein
MQKTQCPGQMTTEVQMLKLVQIITLNVKYLILGHACDYKVGKI